MQNRFSNWLLVAFLHFFAKVKQYINWISPRTRIHVWAFFYVLFSFFSCYWIPLNVAFLMRLPICSVMFGYKKPKLMTLRLNVSRISWLKLTTGNGFTFYTSIVLCSLFFLFLVRRINACIFFSLSRISMQFITFKKKTRKPQRERETKLNSHFTVCVIFSTSSFPFHIDFNFEFCLHFTWQFGLVSVRMCRVINWNLHNMAHHRINTSNEIKFRTQFGFEIRNTDWDSIQLREKKEC